MQFATLEFLVFFAPVLAITWAIRPWPVARKLFLLVASYAFYAGWNTRLLGLIVLQSLIAFTAGEVIARSDDARTRKLALSAALAGELAMLGSFKYYGFFRDNIEALAQTLDTTSGLPILEILLPVGISYTTFQCITYVVDLHRGHGVRARSLLDFLLYIAFFPQVLIGPICRSRDLLAQLHAPAPRAVPDLSRAVSLIASGLFKKVVLSSYLATHLVEDAFASPESYASLELLVASYAYTVQIYCDFSGYTDMALGLGLLLGFHLPDNFNQPYRAQSIAEFWRRWHMTFSNWLRDYVFLPMGGSRRPTLQVWFNLMTVMWVTGIWHGAAWGYMVWGSIHGLALVGYKIVQDRRRARGIDPKSLVHPLWYQALCWLYTFHLIVFARIFFRAADLEVAALFFAQLADLTLWGRGVEWIVLVCTAIGLGLNFWGQHLRRGFMDLHEATPVAVRPALWASIGAAVLLLQPAAVAPYLYFKF